MPAKKQPVVAEKNDPRSWAKKGFVVLLLFATVLVAVLFGANGNVNNAVSRTDKPNTELYFSTTSSLVKEVPKGQKVTVPAVVANHEGKTVTYSYLVTIATKTNGQTSTATEVQRGTLDLADGEKAELPIDFSAPTTTGDYDVTVALEGRNEVIHYTMGVE